MKKIFLVLGILTVIILSTQAIAVVDVANTNVVLTSQSPYPAEPGSTVDIEIEIQNNGLSDSTDVIIEAFPESPISLVTIQDKTKTFSRITAGNSVKATYRLSIDETATSSEYDFKFRIYTDSLKNNFVEKKVSLTIRGNPKLVVSDVSTVPVKVEPGATAKINVLIKNVGSGTARGLEAVINSTSTDLVPVLSGGRIFLGDLNVGQTMEAGFDMSIDTGADYKAYPTTLYLIYKDETNTEQTKTFSIGIPVSGTVTMDIISSEFNLARGTYDIEVANKGTTDATSLEVKLLIDGKSMGVDYVSALKATKKTTFSFPITSEGAGTLVINYQGPGLEQNEITKDLGRIQIISSNGSAYANAFWLLIFLIAVYFIWRKFFRKKRHRQKPGQGHK